MNPIHTLRLCADPARPLRAETRASIARAALILRTGGLVAFPTETVYGLGANALDTAAVARIFVAKNRPSWDPVIVHIAGPIPDNEMLGRVTHDIPEGARRLIEAFWPGPLTLLLPRSAEIPGAVTAGRPLVGVRMPAHPIAFELIREAGVPIAAPSANLFSHISPTTAEHVVSDLDGRIEAVLDAGPAEHGVESTVLDPCQSPMMIYRPGAVTAEQIRAVAGEVISYREQNQAREPNPEALPSPGIGLRHYAPRARLVLIETETGSTVDRGLSELVNQLAVQVARFASHATGLMLPDELVGKVGIEAKVFRWGPWSTPEELARRLYAGLRWLDEQGCSVILCPLPPPNGIGAALHDRLQKAARRS